MAAELSSILPTVRRYITFSLLGSLSTNRLKYLRLLGECPLPWPVIRIKTRYGKKEHRPLGKVFPADGLLVTAGNFEFLERSAWKPTTCRRGNKL
jgi:hypothetical protein